MFTESSLRVAETEPAARAVAGESRRTLPPSMVISSGNQDPTKADAGDALGRGRGLDHGDELFGLIALGAGENNEFVDRVEDGAPLGCSGDGDPAAKAARTACAEKKSMGTAGSPT